MNPKPPPPPPPDISPDTRTHCSLPVRTVADYFVIARTPVQIFITQSIAATESRVKKVGVVSKVRMTTRREFENNDIISTLFFVFHPGGEARRGARVECCEVSGTTQTS